MKGKELFCISVTFALGITQIIEQKEEVNDFRENLSFSVENQKKLPRTWRQSSCHVGKTSNGNFLAYIFVVVCFFPFS